MRLCHSFPTSVSEMSPTCLEFLSSVKTEVSCSISVRLCFDLSFSESFYLSPLPLLHVLKKTSSHLWLDSSRTILPAIPRRFPPAPTTGMLGEGLLDPLFQAEVLPCPGFEDHYAAPHKVFDSLENWVICFSGNRASLAFALVMSRLSFSA
eukprot:IDg6548t1